MDDRRDSARIEAVIDAAHVVDDFLAGVVGLGEGRIGMDGGDRAWWQRALRDHAQRSVVRAMAAAYAPDQLAKAAAATSDLVRAIEAMDVASSPVGRRVAERLRALDVGGVGAVLRDPATRTASPELGAAHARIRRVISIATEARAAALLAEGRITNP